MLVTAKEKKKKAEGKHAKLKEAGDAGDGGEGKKPEEVLEEAVKCLCGEIEVAENEVAAAEAAK